MPPTENPTALLGIVDSVQSPVSGRVAITMIAILAIGWTLLAFDLTRSYSPTIDEVPHAGAGWAIREADDYRVNPEHPPLWKFLSSIPHDAEALPDPTASPLWDAIPTSFILEWAWAANLLYEDDPGRGVAYITRARIVTIGFGFLLGGLTVLWAWKLAGRSAALLATLLFVIEPNLAAHSSLLTSDIPFTATFIGTLFLSSLRPSQRRLEIAATAATGMALGLCLATKFSALILPPLVILLTILRPPLAPGRKLRPLRNIFTELLLIGTIALLTLWATYDFRYAPDPRGGLLDVEHALDYLEHRSRMTGEPGRGLVVSFARFATEARLLPQAYGVGLIWAKATSLGQPAYLLGEISTEGWWYYFPLALLMKLSTVLLMALTLALVLIRRGSRFDRWARLTLFLAPVALLVVAMGTGLNIGLRHVMPVIPVLIIVVSVILGRFLTGRVLAAAAIVFFIGGAVEMAAIHPHHLSYFNLFAGGPARGIELLGDSNLDWGQDLTELGRWSEAHPCTRIRLAYYGSTPPEAYGVDYDPLPVREGTMPSLRTEEDEVLIVSSRYLQGLELSNGVRPFYELLRETDPDEIIGTTLYVYRIGPQASCAGG